MTGIRRLRLTHEEKAQFITASAEAFLEEPSLGIWAAIEKGALTLEPYRRPRKSQAKTWAWLVPAVQEKVAELNKAPPTLEPPDLSTIPTDQLLQELADRFVADAVDKIRDTVAEGIRAEVRSIVTEPLDKPDKKRVTIIGLLKRQEQLIRLEFGKELDLRFHKIKDNKSANIASLCKQADYVLGMVNFIGHSAEDSIRTVAKRYIRVPGGMSALRDKLTELYVNAN